MNGNCAGGTGAFIDQMVTLLDLSMDELDEKASKHEGVHTIASRCGVFAKTDIHTSQHNGVILTVMDLEIIQMENGLILTHVIQKYSNM